MGGGGKGGGGGDTQSQTTTVTPWSGVQPYITNYLSRAQGVSNTPFQFNQGDQIAPLSPEQQYGLSGTTQRAIQGSANNLAAQGNNFGTLTGQYMSPDSNPWLKQTVDQALGDVPVSRQFAIQQQQFRFIRSPRDINPQLGRYSCQSLWQQLPAGTWASTASICTRSYAGRNRLPRSASTNRSGRCSPRSGSRLS